MISLTLHAVDQPRISANQLGEFIFASDTKRRNILRDQKFGNLSAAPYYAAALAAARRSFENGRFSGSALLAEARSIAERQPKTPRQLVKFENNVLALEGLAAVCVEANPPRGEHQMITRNAQMLVDGVTISVMPEIITKNAIRGYIAFTKLRFSKSKIAADVSEIILLLLHHYGQRRNTAGLTFDFGLSKVVDCFSKTVVKGHEVGRHRDQQLHSALANIRAMWPQIEPKV